MTKPIGTTKIDKVMKKEFAKNLIKTGNNKTQAYIDTFKVKNRNKAAINGSRLFRDEEVQKQYKNAGVDINYLARRNKELMDSDNEHVAAGLVKQFNKALLSAGVQRVEKVNVNLFGDLNDDKIKRAERGSFIEGETEETSETSTE